MLTSSYLYILDINPLSDTSFAKSLLLFSRLNFRFVDGFLHCAKAYVFD